MHLPLCVYFFGNTDFLPACHGTMVLIKNPRSGTFQLSIKNKLLPKTWWATFDSCEQARAYDAQLEG